MKLIKNSGNDRVIDALREVLRPESSLDIASPAFSLFAFSELRSLLESVARCRLILPVANGKEVDLELLGSEADRPFRNRLQARWLARQCGEWIKKKTEMRGVPDNSVKNGERSTALRSEIYKTIGGDLNDIYCYLSFVGGWKDMTPTDVIARKRAVDKAMFTYRPFFSKELVDTYETFMKEAFRPYGGQGVDALIRSDIETPDGDRRKHGTFGWQAAWEDRFTKERNKDAQREAYTRFLEQMARDLKL